MDAPGNVPDSINCHSCGAIVDLTGQTGFTHIECQRCGAPSVVPLKFGDFLLLNVIGTGGTGTVYKAIDVPLNRYLALKVPRPQPSPARQSPPPTASTPSQARSSLTTPCTPPAGSLKRATNSTARQVRLHNRPPAMRRRSASPAPKLS